MVIIVYKKKHISRICRSSNPEGFFPIGYYPNRALLSQTFSQVTVGIGPVKKGVKKEYLLKFVFLRH